VRPSGCILAEIDNEVVLVLFPKYVWYIS